MQGFSETVDPVGFTCLGSQRTLCEFSQICERKHLVKQSSKEPAVEFLLCKKTGFSNALQVKAQSNKRECKKRNYTKSLKLDNKLVCKTP